MWTAGRGSAPLPANKHTELIHSVPDAFYRLTARALKVLGGIYDSPMGNSLTRLASQFRELNISSSKQISSVPLIVSPLRLPLPVVKDIGAWLPRGGARGSLARASPRARVRPA